MAEEKERSQGRAPAEFWKWITAVLVSLVLSMGGYILTIENAIANAVQKEVGNSIQVLQDRQQGLAQSIQSDRASVSATAARVSELEASYREIRAELRNIAASQERMLRRLGGP